MTNVKIPSSFRDPSGFIFLKDNTFYRQVNISYKKNYDLLIKSGLFKALVNSDLMVAHKEVSIKYAKSDNAYKVIKPEFIPFISYPYEWSFSQLKDAALITLKIQKIALDHGMSLKDCSAYNVQFRKGKPIFIDTLSFEKYIEGKPWVAPYRQFCRHFLTPLSLMTYTNINLNKLFQVYIDGIPLDLASSLLPFRTYFKGPLFFHIHLNAKLQSKSLSKILDKMDQKMSRQEVLDIINKLESAIEKMRWRPRGTVWADYYTASDCANYSPTAFNHKKLLISKFLDKIKPKTVLDLGANIGVFSRIASDKGILTISVDNDPAAVEKNYLECVKRGETNILPLLIDLKNPSPNIGWDNKERTSFLRRIHVDTILALALIHHLAFSNNVPLEGIANFFNKICNSLIIEFIPKSDSNTKRLLKGREDIFTDYNQQLFENKFKKYFTILDSQKIKDSLRTLYLMKRKKT